MDTALEVIDEFATEKNISFDGIEQKQTLKGIITDEDIMWKIGMTIVAMKILKKIKIMKISMKISMKNMELLLMKIMKKHAYISDDAYLEADENIDDSDDENFDDETFQTKFSPQIFGHKISLHFGSIDASSQQSKHFSIFDKDEADDEKFDDLDDETEEDPRK